MSMLLGTKRALLPGRPATRYYVDATSGNDANDGKTPDLAWETLAKAEGETFLPGESVLLQGLFREQLTLPSGGASGKPITFGVYGSGATINGADIITGWTDYVAGAGSTWESALATEPNQVFMDASRLTEGVIDEDNLADHEWFWVANVLYVRDDTGDPDGSVVIEASQRTYCIDWNAQGWVTIEDIDTIYSNTANVRINGDNFIIQDMLSTYPYDTGIAVNAAGAAVNAGIIRRCEATYSDTASGFYVGWGFDPGPSGVIIDHCSGHHNGSALGDHGVYLNRAHECTVRYSSFYSNLGNGLILQNGSDDNQIYYNICYDNPAEGIWIGTGNAGEDNLIYNNTIFNNATIGIRLWTNASGNIVKNNCIMQDSAVVGDFAACLEVVDDATRQANTFDHNDCYYEGQAARAYEVNAVGYYNLAGWQALAGSPGANSISSDPVFVNEGIPDFHLQAGSLCRNVGEDVGLTQDYDGVSVPQETNPAIGAYEYVA